VWRFLAFEVNKYSIFPRAVLDIRRVKKTPIACSYPGNLLLVGISSGLFGRLAFPQPGRRLFRHHIPAAFKYIRRLRRPRKRPLGLHRPGIGARKTTRARPRRG
jgi:hypothetical protein